MIFMLFFSNGFEAGAFLEIESVLNSVEITGESCCHGLAVINFSSYQGIVLTSALDLDHLSAIFKLLREIYCVSFHFVNLFLRYVE